MKTIFTLLIFTLAFGIPQVSIAQSWANDNGGVYNIPAEEYNPTFHGYGSTDNVIYNKIDLQNGQKMEIDNPSGTAPLYNYLGNQIDDAWNSPIGRDIGNIEPDGYTFRDGGIIAAAIAQIRVGSTNHTMAYAWSVNTRNSGRRSGWIKLSDLTPSTTIKNILEDNKSKRMEILEDGGINRATYEEYKVVSADLPSYMEEYYVDPGRSASKTAGKARYYYTVDEPDGKYISGIKNIPETSRQRYGVAINNIPLDATFYRDRDYPVVSLNIYPPSSDNPESHQLEFVWGYTVAGSGEKIYSFINRRALEATDNPVEDASNKNIAPDGTASQTSTAYSGSASRAIDSNTNGRYWAGSVTHTSTQRNPYWQVKWDDNYIIDEIKVFNRTDCCTQRLSDFKVMILDASNNVQYTKSYTTAPSPSLTINTGGVIGKTVRVQLNGINPLSLAEVEVYGRLSEGGNTGGGSDCSTFKSDNFNSGYGTWNDGGGDAYRGDFSDVTSFTSDVVRIRDNTSGSNIYTDALNLSSYDEANIEFQYYPVSMEAGEDFFLEVSTNGGSSFTIIEEWNSGVEFENGRLYSESVSIPSNMLASNTVFRFRCDATANADQVYLDNIIIETCSENFQNDGSLNSRERVTISEEDSKLSIYPNPAQDLLNVRLDGSSTINELEVLSTFGKRLNIHRNIDDVNYVLDLAKLDSNQAYLVRITTSTGEIIINKFLKL